MRSSSFPSRSSRLSSSAAALLAVGVLGLAAPAAQAKPRITASGTISASGVLVVEGGVRGGASSWRVRLDVRESRTVKGRTVLRWSPRVTSARLGKRTR